MKHVFRVLHSGNPPNLKLPAFFRSLIDFSENFFAVVFVTATTSESKNGVALRTVQPLAPSSFCASYHVAATNDP